jgi:hypothetical protein
MHLAREQKFSVLERAHKQDFEPLVVESVCPNMEFPLRFKPWLG